MEENVSTFINLTGKKEAKCHVFAVFKEKNNCFSSTFFLTLTPVRFCLGIRFGSKLPLILFLCGISEYFYLMNTQDKHIIQIHHVVACVP